TDITPKHMENFIADLKCKGLKNKSVKHIVANLSAMFVWAMESPEDGGPGLVSRNPVTKKVNRLIGSTRAVKKPIDPRWFDIAADTIENRRDRAWFDVTRYVGMRKDETNRLQWTDIDWRAGKVRIPGTKTEESDAWLPVAPAALATLKALRDSEDRDPDSPYVFPGRNPTTRGKKIYDRRHIFSRIRKATAIKKYLRQHPEATEKQALEACKKDGFKGGIHLMPKDLRDYFCTEIASKSNDASVAMKLMRHTSLATTTKYMRTVEARMRDAVESLGSSSSTLNTNLGGDSGGDSMTANGLEMSYLAKLVEMRELAKMLEKYGFLKGKVGKGRQTQNVVPAESCRMRASGDSGVQYPTKRRLCYSATHTTEAQ